MPARPRLALLAVAGFMLAGASGVAGSPISLLPDSEVQGAFTQMPGVLKAYSRGLSYYEAANPEYSVELFRAAFEADSSFLLAKVAEMEAYRALSLDDHAALVREQLLRESGGLHFLQWAESRPGDAANRPEGIETPIEKPPVLTDPSELERPTPYSAESFAQALRHYSEDPADRVRIVRLYARYHPRQWEHRIVLMQHPLTLLKSGQPDDANWMSVALWRTRQERYRRGGGYSFHLDPVESDLAPLLTSHPSSLAATCVQYSIALERASQGNHQEALSLLEDLIRVFSQTKEVDIPCDYWANLYFFAAREARLSGQTQVARDYLEAAQKPANASCGQRYPCLISYPLERIPVVAAISVNYHFSRLCREGPGWALDNFTFGLDRSGRIFEAGQTWWESISPDIQRLADDLAEARNNLSATRRIEGVIARLDARHDGQASTILMREQFLATLLEILDQKPTEESPRGIDWLRLFFRIPVALEFLFKNGSNRWSKAQLREIAERLSAEYQQRTDPSRMDSDLVVMVDIAVRDYEAALRVLDRRNPSRDPYGLCGETRLRGVALRGLQGPEAEVQLYQERIKLLEQMGFRDWICGSDLYGRGAKVARQAGLPRVALDLYQRGIKYLDDLDTRQAEENRTEIIERKASLAFFRGTLYEQLGDREKAAVAFLQVMDLTAGSNMSLYDPALHFSGGQLIDNIFKLAAERLRALKIR